MPAAFLQGSHCKGRPVGSGSSPADCRGEILTHRVPLILYIGSWNEQRTGIQIKSRIAIATQGY
jgi:hypothetical protein